MFETPNALSSLEQLFAPGGGNAFSLVEKKAKVRLCVPEHANCCEA